MRFVGTENIEDARTGCDDGAVGPSRPRTIEAKPGVGIVSGGPAGTGVSGVESAARRGDGGDIAGEERLEVARADAIEGCAAWTRLEGGGGKVEGRGGSSEVVVTVGADGESGDGVLAGAAEAEFGERRRLGDGQYREKET